MIQQFKTSNEPKEYRQILKQTQTRPDTVADKHKQNKLTVS